MGYHRPQWDSKNWKRTHRTEEWSHTEDYRRRKDKQKQGAGFLVNKELTENIEYLYSVSERFAG